MDRDILDTSYNEIDEFMVAFVTEDSPFSNWSAHQVHIWGRRFPTVEHAYQYKKFEKSDPALARKIKMAKSPSEAKRLGWAKSINSQTWDKKREKIMKELITTKVHQHEDIRKALLATGTRAIVEKNNPSEEFWGIGRNNNGRNILGKIWMSLREELIQTHLV